MDFQTLVKFEPDDIEFEEIKLLLAGMEGLGKRPAVQKVVSTSDRDFDATNEDWLYGRRLYLHLVTPGTWHTHEFIQEVLTWLDTAQDFCSTRIKSTWWVETCGVSDPAVAAQCATAFINLIPKLEKVRAILGDIQVELLRRPAAAGQSD